MTDYLEPLKIALSNFGWRDALDIIILAFILYALMKILAKTRAMRVVMGLGVILVFFCVAYVLELSAVVWVFNWLLQASAIFVVILFQPELRRALEKLGRGKIFPNLRSVNLDGEHLVSEFERALLNMAKHKVGAIIVFERQTGLADLVESGTVMDSTVSAELIETVFYPDNPLHDGAMIIKDGRIWAAGCFLPLSDNRVISSELGTRHRASLGVSEVSDAYVLVVSEERGEISFVYDGVLTKGITDRRLTSVLEELYITRKPARGPSAPVDLSANTIEIPVADIKKADEEAKNDPKGGRRSMKERLRDALAWLKGAFTKNIGMKIGALVLAFVVWAFVVTSQNPMRSKTLENVPVTYVGADDMRDRSLAPVEPFSDILNTVNIRVQVEQQNLQNVTPSLVMAQVDLSSITEPGEYTLPIKVDTRAEFITVSDVIPSNVTVRIEESTEKQVPVEVQLEGTKEAGLYYGTPRQSQSTIRIEGNRTAIEQVAKAVCTVDITGLTQSTTATHTLVLVDQGGNELPSSSFSGVPAVIVEVPIYPTRTLTIDTERVRSQITGVADGYEVTGVQVEPKTIEIAGPQEVIDAVSAVGVESIALDNASADVTLDDVALSLPDEVYTSIPENVQVRVEIGPVQSEKSYAGVDVATKNLAEGLVAVVSPEAVDVEASGSATVLNSISADQVLPFVDLAGYGVGTYEVPIKFENEGDLEVTLTPSTQEVAVTIRRG